MSASVPIDHHRPGVPQPSLRPPSHAMSLTFAKILMRVVGTLAGLLGLGMLCILPFLIHHAIAEQMGWMILFAVFPLPVAAYFIYAAYLVWIRFSPVAVRHVCGALGFYTLTLFPKAFERFRDADWMPFAFFGCLVAVYLACCVVSHYLSRRLFPEASPAVQS